MNVTAPTSCPDVLRLADTDNIVTAVRNLSSGYQVQGIILQCDVAVGHKIAAVAIAKGEKIIKWGCPIGSATRDIAAGEHVHTHNLKSDYIPTFTLDNGRRFVEGR